MGFIVKVGVSNEKEILTTMKKILFVSGLTLFFIGAQVTTLAAEEVSTDGHIGMEVVEPDSGMISSATTQQSLSRVVDSKYDGGWWYRGQQGNRLVSEYKHYDKQGRGSCRNGNGTFSDGGWKKKNVFSKSSVGYTTLGGNKVYYDYK